jgi:hypothetical protein
MRILPQTDGSQSIESGRKRVVYGHGLQTKSGIQKENEAIHKEDVLLQSEVLRIA